MEEVEVEVFVGVFVESVFYGYFVIFGVISLVGVDGFVSVGEGERDVIGGKSWLENVELVVDYGVLLIWLVIWCWYFFRVLKVEYLWWGNYCWG